MARVRTKWYEKHGISRERYFELKWISEQYNDMDPFAWRKAAIKEAAQAGAGDLWPYVLENVTQGRAFCTLDAPCCPKVFYRARRQYFEELHRLLSERVKT